MEPTPDMLPDTELDVPPKEVVSEDAKPPVSEKPGKEAPENAEPQVPEGYVPYSRFKEVNEELKALKKERSEDLQEPQTPEYESERVEALEKEMRDMKMGQYLSTYPELNDKREELDAFLEEMKLPLERAILLFRAEQGMMTAPKDRKGLEKPVGGPKSAPKPKWTLEAIDNLRQTNEKEWQKRMSAGEFDEALKTW